MILGRRGSAAVADFAEPHPAEGELLVDGPALGVCGTDREIVEGEYGRAPPGEERLVLGHESLGRPRGVGGNPIRAGGRGRGDCPPARAAEALAKADRAWLESLITRRVPLERFEEALAKHDDDVKVVLELGS